MVGLVGPVSEYRDRGYYLCLSVALPDKIRPLDTVFLLYGSPGNKQRTVAAALRLILSDAFAVQWAGVRGYGLFNSIRHSCDFFSRKTTSIKC